VSKHPNTGDAQKEKENENGKNQPCCQLKTYAIGYLFHFALLSIL
jgi:hypothetical protein